VGRRAATGLPAVAHHPELMLPDNRHYPVPLPAGLFLPVTFAGQVAGILRCYLGDAGAFDFEKATRPIGVIWKK